MTKEKEIRVELIINSTTILIPLGHTVSPLSIYQVPAGSNDFINIMNFINFQLN